MSANAPQLPGGGWAQLELTDALAKCNYRLSTSSSQDQELFGHLPIELSFLLCKFLSCEGCSLEFSLTGARFLKDRLVVPGRYTAFSNNQACVSQKARKLFGPENVPEKLPKTVFCVSQSTRKVRAREKSRQFTPKSYGSSHAPKNVFGKLIDDKNGSCWSTFFEKFYSVK